MSCPDVCTRYADEVIGLGDGGVGLGIGEVISAHDHSCTIAADLVGRKRRVGVGHSLCGFCKGKFFAGGGVNLCPVDRPVRAVAIAVIYIYAEYGLCMER